MQNNANEYNSITDYFELASSMSITKQNENFTYLKGDDKFELILSALETITNNSQDMPAYSVSLDSETKKAKENGTWLELEFGTQKSFNELPFESLLIEVNEDFQGINIIRKNNGTYDGRCFYLNLNSNMKELSKAINTISN